MLLAKEVLSLNFLQIFELLIGGDSARPLGLGQLLVEAVVNDLALEMLHGAVFGG